MSFDTVRIPPVEVDFEPVGKRVQVAPGTNLLEAARIPVLDRDVGGERGRKLVFVSDEGTAWVKLL